MNAERLLDHEETRLAELAAKLLGLSFAVAARGSSEDDLIASKRTHDDEKLWPRLTITAPHGGGGVKVELTLHDPHTDEAVIRMIEIEAEATPIC